MFFNKLFGGSTATTTPPTTKTENETEGSSSVNNSNVSGESRFSSFGLNKISMSSDTFKKLGSSVSSFATNVYQKIEEETKKLVEEGPNTYSDCTMMPPWNDFQIEDKERQAEIREKILELKMSKSTFLTAPPIDADYFQEFNEYLVKVATVSLKYDPVLQKIRFHFVPKLISEEQFWKNWFYKVTLIKKQYNIVSSTNDIGTTNESKENNNNSGGSGGDNEENSNKEDQVLKDVDNSNNNKEVTSPPIEETEMGKWEKELQSELENFNSGGNGTDNDGNIDFSLNNDLLNDDDDDGINSDNEDWESKIGLELQQSKQPHSSISSPIISYSPVTDSDVDIEIERELQRMSQVGIVDKSTTEELIEEIESEIQQSQKDGLSFLSLDDQQQEEDLNNCSNIEINNNNIEINNDYDTSTSEKVGIMV